MSVKTHIKSGALYLLIGALYLSLAALLCVVLSGCGHNAVQYSDGIGLEVGFIPEQYMLAVNFRYGKIFSAVVKEKTEIELKAEAKNAAGTGAESVTDTGVASTLTIKTGDQTTGYVVDLEKVRQGK